MQTGVTPDYCRAVRVRQGGTTQAKQDEFGLSTAGHLFSIEGFSRIDRGSADGHRGICDYF
jgi:hypothetical protein